MNRLRWHGQDLSEEDQAGQLLLVGVDGTTLDAELSRKLNRVRPGGVILFARNLQDAPQVAAFCSELRSFLPVPPFLAIDQEGGRVSRLKGIFPPIPANLSLAHAQRRDSLVREHGAQTGRGLSLLGFNVNFAPVLDLSEADHPNGIGDRAYGADPLEVARLARIFLESQGLAGVLGCGKHFPGLGGGRVDSHLDLPRIDRPADDLWREDLLPYRRLGESLPMVMVGHAHYPALQGKVPGPATLSGQVVEQLLRGRIGYRGIILTDDLEMGAVDQSLPPGKVALQALSAGNDLVMYCKSWERIEEAHSALVRALRSGSLSPARVEASLSRILTIKKRLPLPGSVQAFEAGTFAEVCENLGRLAHGLRA